MPTSSRLRSGFLLPYLRRPLGPTSADTANLPGSSLLSSAMRSQYQGSPLPVTVQLSACLPSIAVSLVHFLQSRVSLRSAPAAQSDVESPHIPPGTAFGLRSILEDATRRGPPSSAILFEGPDEPSATDTLVVRNETCVPPSLAALSFGDHDDNVIRAAAATSPRQDRPRGPVVQGADDPLHELRHVPLQLVNDAQCDEVDDAVSGRLFPGFPAAFPKLRRRQDDGGSELLYRWFGEDPIFQREDGPIGKASLHGNPLGGDAGGSPPTAPVVMGSAMLTYLRTPPPKMEPPPAGSATSPRRRHGGVPGHPGSVPERGDADRDHTAAADADAFPTIGRVQRPPNYPVGEPLRHSLLIVDDAFVLTFTAQLMFGDELAAGLHSDDTVRGINDTRKEEEPKRSRPRARGGADGNRYRDMSAKLKEWSSVPLTGDERAEYSRQQQYLSRNVKATDAANLSALGPMALLRFRFVAALRRVLRSSSSAGGDASRGVGTRNRPVVDAVWALDAFETIVYFGGREPSPPPWKPPEQSGGGRRRDTDEESFTTADARRILQRFTNAVGRSRSDVAGPDAASKTVDGLSNAPLSRAHHTLWETVLPIFGFTMVRSELDVGGSGLVIFRRA